MKKMQILAIAALAAAVTFQTAAKADDPISPVQGAVCNLYLIPFDNDSGKVFSELAAMLATAPAAATFVDSSAEFKPSQRRNDVSSTFGQWTGWMKEDKAGTYTFLCKRGWWNQGQYRYSIWINGHKCAEAAEGQVSFDVDLNAGFNEVKIIAGARNAERNYPLSISYKKKGSVKDSISFGPGDMFYDDEE